MRESHVLEMEYIWGVGGSFPPSEYIHFLMVCGYVFIHNKRIKFKEPDFVNRVNHLITAR
jgi:hypothetical protein